MLVLTFFFVISGSPAAFAADEPRSLKRLYKQYLWAQKREARKWRRFLGDAPPPDVARVPLDNGGVLRIIAGRHDDIGSIEEAHAFLSAVGADPSNVLILLEGYGERRLDGRYITSSTFPVFEYVAQVAEKLGIPVANPIVPLMSAEAMRQAIADGGDPVRLHAYLLDTALFRSTNYVDGRYLDKAYGFLQAEWPLLAEYVNTIAASTGSTSEFVWDAYRTSSPLTAGTIAPANPSRWAADVLEASRRLTDASNKLSAVLVEGLLADHPDRTAVMALVGGAHLPAFGLPIA